MAMPEMRFQDPSQDRGTQGPGIYLSKWEDHANLRVAELPGMWAQVPNDVRESEHCLREPVITLQLVSGLPYFFQPVGLADLLKELRGRSLHTVVYSGYTLELLARRSEPAVWEALSLINLLVDGPFVAALAEGAGEWRGSRNQRLIHHPARILDARNQSIG